MVTLFGMFLGKVDELQTIPKSNPLKVPFFVLFMLFFYIISVQMWVV